MFSNDFLMNLAASLAYDFIKAILNRLPKAFFGEEQQALQRVYQLAFADMFTTTASSLSTVDLGDLELILRDFFSDEQVSTWLLEVALKGQPLPLEQLRERFSELGFNESTLPISLEKALEALSQSLEHHLRVEAGREKSPLHNRVVVEELDSLTQQVNMIAQTVVSLGALQDSLQRLMGQTILRIGGDVTGSIIVIGDGNHLTVNDGGSLARRWSVLQLDEAEVQTQYRQEVASIYESLFFPLSGLSFAAMLDEIYQPLALTRHPLGSNWRPRNIKVGELFDMDQVLEEGKQAALLGLLGTGKTTALHYLTWVYARKPENHLHWRQDELIPFYLTARDLAITWQGETDFIPTVAQSAARRQGRTLLDPLLVERKLRLALDEGNALLLVDALDEYRSSPEEPRDFIPALHSRWKSKPFSENILLVTSRPHDFLQAGFQTYALCPLEESASAQLAYRLGNALRQQFGAEPEGERESGLRELSARVISPRLQEFSTPFYITLLTVLACREPDFASGLKHLSDITRLADLYRFFLRQTINWEKGKGYTLPDERSALLTLAELAWQTFVSPSLREMLSLQLTSEAEQAQTLTFWQRTGLLRQDDFTLEWEFYHSGFQTFGVALMLDESWQRGRRHEIQRLQEETRTESDWDIIWQLFYGLRGTAYERSSSS